MSTVLNPDAGAFALREQAGRPSSDGSAYARILDLNLRAQHALKSGVQSLTSVDSVKRTHAGQELRTGISEIASAFITTISTTASHHPAKASFGMDDVVIDRISRALPEPMRYAGEVKTMLRGIPEKNGMVAKEVELHLIELYALRAVEDAVQERSDEICILQTGLTGMSHEPVQITQARGVLVEMNEFGLESVQRFYHFASLAHHATSEKQVSLIAKSLEKEHMHPEVRTSLVAVVESKRRKLEEKSREGNGEGPPKTSKREVAQKFMEELRETYRYIESITPDEQKGFLSKVPLTTLELIHNTRTLVNALTDRIATSSEIREMFWQLRLGRQVGEFYKNHPLRFAKPADLRHYSEHLYDRLLRSEGSGFELERDMPVTVMQQTPHAALSTTVEELVRQNKINFPQDRTKPLLFSVIMNDDVIIKLHIAPNASREQIEEAVAKAHKAKLKLTHAERADISVTGYQTSDKRWKSSRYRSVFGHGELNKTPADYVVHVTNTPQRPDRMKADSLFHVGPAKAAVGIHIGASPHLAVIYNHGFFDGVPAKESCEQLFGAFEKNGQLDAVHDPATYLTLAHVYQPEKQLQEYPLLEGEASQVDNFAFQKIQVPLSDGTSVTLSPTDVRAIAIGLANNVDYIHHLYAGALPSEYALQNPTHNNVQPNVVGLEVLGRILNDHLVSQGAKPVFNTDEGRVSFKNKILQLFREKKHEPPAERLMEWVHEFGKSAIRCKNGEGPAATLSSVTGTWEGILGKIAGPLHPGTKTLTQAGGMFSSVINVKGSGEPLTFWTAHSDSYSPKSESIDLLHPTPSMGVVGYNQEGKNGKAVMTCRKFPGQAQVELRSSIMEWFSSEERDVGRSQNTLQFMTPLIQEWDKLTHGRTTMGEYLETLERTYDLLLSTGGPGAERLAAVFIGSAADLQRYLNDALKKAAAQTIQPARIQHAYQIFAQSAAEMCPLPR